MITIVDYAPKHRTSWLRCRVLGFLDTCYYDDVWNERPDGSEIQLVAINNDEVVGILDVGIAASQATINTIVVHPDHRRDGIARRLLEEARTRLPATVKTLDAWTREDEAALRWYCSNGFVGSEHYLHVHKDCNESSAGFSTPEGLQGPVLAFCHAQLSDEDRLRSKYKRVYVCRRLTLELMPTERPRPSAGTSQRLPDPPDGFRAGAARRSDAPPSVEA